MRYSFFETMMDKSRIIFYWIGLAFFVQILVIPFFICQTRRTSDLQPQEPQPKVQPQEPQPKADKNVQALPKNTSRKIFVANFAPTVYFEPWIRTDFPQGKSDTPIIPEIIHQTYKDTNIPVHLAPYITSLVANNQNWTYFFWTDTTARKFVIKKFPQLLPMWEDYKSPINRADAIRYLVLYEYGGFYGDLDVECKRSFDEVTTKYSCIFPTEPFEHSAFMYKMPYLITNAIMFCRPKHPFLKHLIDSLHQYQSMTDQLDVAGPSFVTSQFIRYNNITADEVYKVRKSNESNSPYFYKGTLPEDDANAVYIPNTQYFMNSVDTSWMNKQGFKTFCLPEDRKRSSLVTKACNEYKRRQFQRNRDRFAFTDHHWYHSYGQSKKNLRNTIPLRTLVRNIKYY